MNLTSGGDIIFNPGSVNTAGGTLTLNPGNGGSVKPLSSGTDVNVAPARLNFGAGSNLAISINGLAAGSDYTQLSVIGDVNLAGVNLVLTGNFTMARSCRVSVRLTRRTGRPLRFGEWRRKGVEGARTCVSPPER